MFCSQAFALEGIHGEKLEVLTTETIKKIREGKIRYKDGTIDTFLFGQLPLDPSVDSDKDGLRNDEELFTYHQDGKQYLYYKSHPFLEDTDGDGYPDKIDPDPLSWNVSPRDAILFQELSYRDDDYIARVLDHTRDLPSSQYYEGRLEYKLMHNELAEYWKVTKHWHEGSGFDATLFEFSNKRFPFLKDKSTHMLAIRGTAGVKDFGSDISLGLGSWPSQANDAIKVADELDKSRPRNTYVTGHSLGGFLAQVFFVRSVGKPYGPASNNDRGADLNYHDKNKKENPEIKQIFTFNAPALLKGGSPWLREYSTMGDTLTRRLHSRHYVVANDSVSNTTGAMEYAIRLPASDQGHSSRSFFEYKFRNVDGFSIGKRYDLSGTGYHDDLRNFLNFVKPTVVKIVDNQSGKTLDEITYAYTPNGASYANPASLVPKHYKIVSEPGTLTYGTENVYRVDPVTYTLSYVFKLGDELVSQTDIKTYHQGTYTAPAIPKYADEDYVYELADNNSIPQLAPSEIVGDRRFEIQLQKKALEVHTKIDFIDKKGEVLKSKDITTRPSQKDDLVLDESELPEGYEYAPNPPRIVPGSEYKVSLNKKRYTLEYSYQLDGRELKREQIELEYGADSPYELNLPQDYVLADGFNYTPATHVTENLSITIPLKRKPPEVHQVNIRFMHEGKQVAERQLSITHGEEIPKQIPPVHERAQEGYAWVIDPKTSYMTEVNGDMTIEVKLLQSTPALKVRPVPQYQVVVQYVYDSKTVKEDRLTLSHGQAIQPQAPVSSQGVYHLNLEGINLTPNSNTTVVIPMSFEKKLVKVVIKYRDEEGSVVLSDEFMLPVGELPQINRYFTTTSGKEYRVDEAYEPSSVDENTGELIVPVITIKPQPKPFTLDIAFVDASSNEVVGTTSVELYPGDKVPQDLKLPEGYKLDSSYSYPAIDAYRLEKIPVYRDPEVLPPNPSNGVVPQPEPPVPAPVPVAPPEQPAPNPAPSVPDPELSVPSPEPPVPAPAPAPVPSPGNGVVSNPKPVPPAPEPPVPAPAPVAPPEQPAPNPAPSVPDPELSVPSPEPPAPGSAVPALEPAPAPVPEVRADKEQAPDVLPEALPKTDDRSWGYLAFVVLAALSFAITFALRAHRRS